MEETEHKDELPPKKAKVHREKKEPKATIRSERKEKREKKRENKKSDRVRTKSDPERRERIEKKKHRHSKPELHNSQLKSSNEEGLEQNQNLTKQDENAVSAELEDISNLVGLLMLSDVNPPQIDTNIENASQLPQLLNQREEDESKDGDNKEDNDEDEDEDEDDEGDQNDDSGDEILNFADDSEDEDDELRKLLNKAIKNQNSNNDNNDNDNANRNAEDMNDDNNNNNNEELYNSSNSNSDSSNIVNVDESNVNNSEELKEEDITVLTCSSEPASGSSTSPNINSNNNHHHASQSHASVSKSYSPPGNLSNSIVDKKKHHGGLQNFLSKVKKTTQKNDPNKISISFTPRPSSPPAFQSTSPSQSRKDSGESSSSSSSLVVIDTPKHSERELIINEIISTEKDYVEDLAIIIEEFLDPIRRYQILNSSEIQTLFSNIEVIYDINKGFLKELEERTSSSGSLHILIGEVFLRLTNYFKLYTMYCINQEMCSKLYNQLREAHLKFDQFLMDRKRDERCRQLDLIDFLIKPMQRLCKYPLFLKELLKNTEANHEDYANIESAFTEVAGVVKYINDRKRVGENQQKVIDIQHSIEACPKIMIAGRKYCREAYLTILENKQKHKRKLILFNDLILIAKNKKGGLLRENEEDLTFCQTFYLKKLKIIDHADNDELKNAFELGYKDVVGNLIKTMMFCADTLDDKRSWIKDIRTLIKNYQREEYLENKQKIIREKEEKDKRVKEQQDLNRTEANPLPEDNNDVWTLGLLLWHMYTGKPLFEGLTFEEAAIAFMTHKYPPILTPELPNDFKDLLEDCFLDNPELRPDYSMVYDRLRMLDITRPKDPLAIAWAGRQAEEYAANAMAKATAAKKLNGKKK